MKKQRNKKHCRKMQYSTKMDARKALKKLRHIGLKRFYACPHCGGVYHLTGQDEE